MCHVVLVPQLPVGVEKYARRRGGNERVENQLRAAKVAIAPQRDAVQRNDAEQQQARDEAEPRSHAPIEQEAGADNEHKAERRHVGGVGQRKLAGLAQHVVVADGPRRSDGERQRQQVVVVEHKRKLARQQVVEVVVNHGEHRVENEKPLRQELEKGQMVVNRRALVGVIASHAKAAHCDVHVCARVCVCEAMHKKEKKSTCRGVFMCIDARL